MSGAGKAALVGGVLAAGVAIIAGMAFAFGLVEIPFQRAEPAKILIVAAAPDEEGSDLAALAFVVDTTTGQVTLLDTWEDATISGTSAATAAEALPFGGGDAVAAALSPQTGGAKLEWVVLPAEEWAGLIDAAGGIAVDVPQSLSAYTRSGLTVVEPGPQDLTGAQAVGVASAIKYLGDPQDQKAVLRQLTAALSAITGSRGPALRALVSESKADSSLDAEKIPDLSAVQ